MRKLMKSIQMMGALLVAVAAMTACTNEDNYVDEQNKTTDGKTMYMMTVEATLGGGDEATTRALAIDADGALKAKWTEGDVVTVTKESGGVALDIGTLRVKNESISADGRSCTLTGLLDIHPSENDELTLQFNNGGYTSQKGTLDYIAKHCDIAKATVKVKTSEAGIISDENGTERTGYVITTTGPADFVNQQAIVKFSLKKADGTALSVRQLQVKQGTMSIKVTPDAAASDLYVAIPEGDGKVRLTATLEDGSLRIYDKTGVTFENGKYYTVGVKMTIMGTKDLSTLTGDDYTAKDGDVLYGTLPQDIRLKIENGAKVTLNGVTTQKAKGVESDFPGIECLGSATIVLGGTNKVVSPRQYYPCIYVPSGKTLTIEGDGKLSANGHSSAGIGGGDDRTEYKNCGNITIKGGTVNAKGGTESAGIGSGYKGTCGNITISGGTVTATTDNEGPGIGTGKSGKCGNITISGGNVTATGGSEGAGIGTGKSGKCGNITISGGSVTATGGQHGAGIGSGISGTCKEIIISGGSGTAGSDAVYCIGGDCEKVTVNGQDYGTSGIATSTFTWPTP